jgi:hypothetical protein
MPPEILITLALLLVLWAVYRIGRYAVRPLLADMRATAAVEAAYAPPRSAVEQSALVRATIRTAVLAGLAAVAFWFSLASGMIANAPLFEVPLNDTFVYSYYPNYDVPLNLALAAGVGIFTRNLGIAALTLLVFSALAVIADFLFNLAGSHYFATNSDLYTGGEYGNRVWLAYYLIVSLVYLVGLSSLFGAFRSAAAWASVLIVTLAMGALTFDGPLLPFISDYGDISYAFLATSAALAGTIGWWLKRKDA